MDETRFQEAKRAYDSGDFRTAAKTFLAAAQCGTEGAGSAYHMAGNSLMRLRRYSDAMRVFEQSLRDEVYDRRGAVQANLGACHVALGEYAEAVESYRTALEEPDYQGHHRALQGMAGALFEMGKYAEAAAAYRQAALDGDNPDPGRALNNLGLSFMALGRPADAVEAYKAALGFEDYPGRGRALANLGIAFHAFGDYANAVKSFEKAVELHDHTLSEQARAAFDESRARLDSKREVVDGWTTGEMPPVFESDHESSDLEESVEALPASDPAPARTAVLDPVPVPSAMIGSAAVPVPAEGSSAEEDFDQGPESNFFTVTDEEMREQDRKMRRSERDDRKSTDNPWTRLATIAVVLVLAVATVAAAYYAGYGFPTQRMTVSAMLEARGEGAPVEAYWVAVPTSDVDKEMAKLPPVQEFEIGLLDRSPRTSRMTVTVVPENGSPLQYEITLAREGFGWKVSGIENDWSATGGDS